MGSRSHTTFKKRQKEQARTEKAREKLEKRLERKTEKGSLPADGSIIIDGTSDLDDHSLDVLNLASLDAVVEEEEEASEYPRTR